MILVSLSRHGLQCMLSICYKYSEHRRFEYNSEKCGVIALNDSVRSCRDRKWYIGTQQLNEVEVCNQLSLICDESLSTAKSLNDASNKLRGTVLNILNSGLHPGGLNPRTLKTLYQSVVLNKALYGCELWNTWTPTDIKRLEVAHMVCVKHIQSLKLSTNTDFSLATLDVDSLKTGVDAMKLSLFGQLCRLPCRY
ncbi:hypothetical protein DPMN_015089 [Dreissena polymorpha]|uniref:Reverse transcriptase domain-containing protein n=1 Tax=Dreissena polymorpha TaxID=45954 RepID=A0A9D4S598_DREPO|nr:hypothetical protein DPMN_015089 [Dreissena polymorpha]